MVTEASIGINDSEFTSFPGDFSVFSVPVPKILGEKEVIISNLSSERGRRNVENSFTSVIVVDISGYLRGSNLPSWVVTIAIDWAEIVEPGFIESFNGFDVVLLTHSDD